MQYIDLELARGTFIVGLLMAVFVYERFRLVSGGTITGSYVAFLLVIGSWQDVVAWAALTAIAYGILRLTTFFVPLPKAWLIYLGILVPAAIHVGLIHLSWLEPFTQYTLILQAGLYVTNGLTAYDLLRQGKVKTISALAVVVALTSLIMWPLHFLYDSRASHYVSQQNLFATHPAIVIFFCIFAATAVRLGLGLGTAGIIGGAFLSQLLDPASIVLIIVIAIIGSYIFRWVSSRLAMTPHQKFHVALIVGGIVTWFALFWAQRLGIPGAEAPSAFAIEPLLVVGLLLIENVKLKPIKAMSGTLIVLAVVLIAQWLVTEGRAFIVPGYIGLTLFCTALFIPGFRKMTRGWSAAREQGKIWQVV